VGVVQPQNALLSVAVLAAAGRSFPMWSQPAAFTPHSLAASYSNFPNPFAAGREKTHFVFNLPGPGRVDLVIWTVRGGRVVTLMSGVATAAGLHQSTVWDGRNGRGAVVANGAYIAELVAHLD